MSVQFKKGDIVKCIDDSSSQNKLIKGNLYKVQNVDCCNNTLSIPCGEIKWMNKRFELYEPKFKIGDKVKIVNDCLHLGELAVVLVLNIGLHSNDVLYLCALKEQSLHVYESALELAKEGNYWDAKFLKFVKAYADSIIKKNHPAELYLPMKDIIAKFFKTKIVTEDMIKQASEISVIGYYPC